MTTTRFPYNVWSIRVCFAALALAGFMGVGGAAEKVSYQGLQKRIAPYGSDLNHRGVNVTTVDGKKHSGGKLRFDSDHVRLFRGTIFEDLPRDQIAKIEIRRGGIFGKHFGHGLVLPVVGMFACGSGFMSDAKIGFAQEACSVIVGVALLPPALAYTVASIPVLLAADRVASLVPPKVYEIVR